MSISTVFFIVISRHDIISFFLFLLFFFVCVCVCVCMYVCVCGVCVHSLFLPITSCSNTYDFFALLENIIPDF